MDPSIVLLSATVRKRIFKLLVDLQDQGMSVAESRAKVSQQYALTQEQLAEIEHAGIEQNWPPLKQQ